MQARSQAEARKHGLQHHMGIDHETLTLLANNKGADQPAHPRSLISAFIIRYLKSKVTIGHIHVSLNSPFLCAST